MPYSTKLASVQLMPLLCKALNVVLWYLLLVPTIFIGFPIILIWRLVAALLIKMQYDNPTLMSSYDALFTATENCNENVVAFSIQFKGKLDCDKIKQLISDEFAARYIRCRSYIVEKYNHFFWLEDKNFNIDNHLRFHPEMLKTHQEMMDVMQESVAVPFSPKTSPWFFDVYALDPKYDGGKGDETFFCLVCHFHHALADGYSIQATLYQALCGENKPDLSTVVSSQKGPSVLQQVGGWLYLLLFFPYVLGELIFTNTNVYENLGENKRINIRSNVLKVDTAKRIKRTWNVPFSSILMSCCCAGIQKHLKRTGIVLPQNLATAITYRVWDVTEAIEPQNKFVTLFFKVPIGSKSAKERLLLLHQSMINPLNFARKQVFNVLCSRAGELFPSCLMRPVFRLVNPTMVMTTHVERENMFVMSDNGSVLYKLNFTLSFPKSTGFAFVWHTLGDEITVDLFADGSLGSAEEMKTILNDIEYELTLLDKETRKIKFVS